MKNNLKLTKIKDGVSGVIDDIQGGEAFIRRVESLGIRKGVKISKISSHFWKGPVTIKVGKTKVAMGHGMAEKILVRES